MNKTAWISFAMILMASCSPKLRSYSPNISSSPGPEETTLFVQASGLATEQPASYESAIYNALSTLLYQGIPGSVQPKPMIPPEDAARVRSKVDNCLHDNNCFRNFIMQVNQVGGIVKVKGGYEATANLKVNLTSVRTWLEQNNIIRKFGL